MAKQSIVSIATFFFFSSFIFSSSNAAYNVISYGAKPDGISDSTQAFLRTWTMACSSLKPATMTVPKGSYLLKAIEFRGPCKSKITVIISGTIVAPSGYQALGNSGSWILFIQVSQVAVFGGTIDAKGASQWACRSSGKSCPAGATSIQFNWANNIVINGLTSINSRRVHFSINRCNNVVARNIRLIAPDQSPNTDGIHVQHSNGVKISVSDIRTGDDCVSIGPGTTNLRMDRIRCGPGHGISIGSLANNAIEAGVQNVTLTNSVFIGSDNGVRIKSWARKSNGFVKNVVYRNLVMNNVKNPIIIDQNYCPSNQAGCPHQVSKSNTLLMQQMNAITAKNNFVYYIKESTFNPISHAYVEVLLLDGQGTSVKISGVTYKNIKGTSATPIAVMFTCSSLNPCSGIRLEDIKLTYLNGAAASSCQNIGGTSGGTVAPLSCL